MKLKNRLIQGVIKTSLTVAFVFFYTFWCGAQKNSQNPIWKSASSSKSEMDLAYLNVQDYEVIEIDLIELMNQLQNNKNPTVSLPISKSKSETFELTSSGVLPTALAAKYTNLHSYVGVGVDDPSNTICLDITPTGYHAVIRNGDQRTFIDPIKLGDRRSIVYQSKNFIPHNSKAEASAASPCQLGHDHSHEKSAVKNRGVRATNGTLRTYRLAALCTGEYAAFHGGTKEGALGAIMTTVNRVNEIYVRELGVKLVLIPNTDDLLFTNSNTDGLSNTDNLIDELTEKINGIIPIDSYDLGHGFSTAGGGVAQFASVCTDRKAEGVTGSSNPVGDAFDIDFVAHEFGHQFSGDHSFRGDESSCSGNAVVGRLWEPGGGSTIMAYAGICGSQNIQNQSDAYFHGGNLTIMHDFIQAGPGSTCGAVANTGNTNPSVLVSGNGKVVPALTPLFLEGSATDPGDQDALTYCWEQIDGNGELGNYDLQTTRSAIFRSYNPVSTPVRYLPNLNDLAANREVRGMNLPNLSRDLNFRLTVRDNKATGGAVGHADLKMQVDANSGPFELTSQGSSGISYELGSTFEVNWDVANTNVAPVDAQFVAIYLSTDGGLTYPETLIQNTLNDGQELINLPSNIGLVSNQCRLMVKASQNYFFAINDINFSIVEPSTPTFSLFTSTEQDVICGNDESTILLTSNVFNGFSGDVSLTYNALQGIQLIGQPLSIAAGESASFKIVSDGTLPNGTHELEVTGVSQSITKTSTITFVLIGSILKSDLVLLNPSNGNNAVGINPVFKWETNSIFSSYRLEVDTAADFASLVASKVTPGGQAQLDKQLEPNQSYYWKVVGTSQCGGEFQSSVSTFATTGVVCQSFANNNEVTLYDGADFSSTISVGIQETVVDVRVSLKGTHEYTNDLIVSLVSPNDKEAILFQAVCGGRAGEDFDLTLNDESTLEIPCTPRDGRAYIPEESLSTFDGVNTSGDWVLKLQDQDTDVDVGVLERWSIELCYLSDQALQPAFLENNDILIEGGNAMITSAALSANDPNGPNDLVIYTILSTSTIGDIEKNNVKLTLGQTFTQADIKNGLISFSPLSSVGEPILVSLTDQEQSISEAYPLNITVLVGIEPINASEIVTVFPNPTNGNLTIKNAQGWTLYSLIGEEIIQGEENQMDISWLPPGVYILEANQQSFRLIKQ